MKTNTVSESRMALNLNQLRIFFVCGKHSTFSEAADNLFLSQPAVTAQIKQLEAYCGVDLFEHHRKRIELTEAGRILFNYAQKIFELAESAEKSVLEFKNLKKGVLRIGTLKVYARFMMPPLITSYNGKYPGIQVVLNEGSSVEITRWILDHKIELGLVSMIPPFPSQFEVIPYSQEELALIVPSDHPLNKKPKVFMKDLAHEPLIVREKGSVSREVILAKYHEAKIEPGILIEAKNLAFIIEQVQAGKGISFIAESAFIIDQVQAGKGISFIAEWALKHQLELGSLKIRSLADGPFLINVAIAYLKSQNLSPMARAFIDLLIEKRNSQRAHLSPSRMKNGTISLKV